MLAGNLLCSVPSGQACTRSREQDRLCRSFWSQHRSKVSLASAHVSHGSGLLLLRSRSRDRRGLQDRREFLFGTKNRGNSVETGVECGYDLRPMSILAGEGHTKNYCLHTFDGNAASRHSEDKGKVLAGKVFLINYTAHGIAGIFSTKQKNFGSQEQNLLGLGPHRQHNRFVFHRRLAQHRGMVHKWENIS